MQVSGSSGEAEKAMLLDYLRGQRRHVLGILDGLDEEAMRTAVLPSGWTCLGVLQHLAVDGEQFWFQAVMGGDQGVISRLESEGDSWQVDSRVSVAEVFERYRRACEQADLVIDATSLDAPPAWWPGHLFGDWRLEDLREVMLHMIVEVACHAGHLDAARELIDGRQWMVVDGDDA